MQGDQVLSRRRWAGAGLTVLLLTLQVLTAVPAEGARSLTVTPETGAPGSIAEVTGSGFTLSLPVDLCWGESGCANLGTVLPNLSGEFSATITIPAFASDRRYRIHACQLSILGDLLCANTMFTVATAATTSTSADTATPPSTTSPATTPTTEPTSTEPAPPTTTALTTTIDNPSTSTPPPPSTPGGDDQEGPAEASTLKEVGAPAEEPADAPAIAPLPFLAYTPPQPSSGFPTADSPGLGQGEATDNSFFAGGETDSGWSLDSPIAFWTAWLIAVAAASGLLSIGRWWLQRRNAVDS